MAYTKKATATTKHAKPATKAPQAPERPKDSWNNISGTMNVWVKLFENEQGTYNAVSLTIGRQDGNGGYNNYYLPVKFSSALREFAEALPEGLVTLEVVNAFITVTQYKGSFVPCVMITEIA